MVNTTTELGSYLDCTKRRNKSIHHPQLSDYRYSERLSKSPAPRISHHGGLYPPIVSQRKLLSLKLLLLGTLTQP